ncbi:MAG: hypothetical protein OXG79_09375 [Chloroflexi bacterium]|nr:hypothetical protein [Chloroflexota bacterium]
MDPEYVTVGRSLVRAELPVEKPVVVDRLACVGAIPLDVLRLGCEGLESDLNYWLFVVTNCAAEPKLQEAIKDPAQRPCHEVRKVQHYRLAVDALTQPMVVREDQPPYGGRTHDA